MTCPKCGSHECVCDRQEHGRVTSEVYRCADCGHVMFATAEANTAGVLF